MSLQILKTKLPYDPAIPLWGIYLKEMKSLLEEISILSCSLQCYSQQQTYCCCSVVSNSLKPHAMDCSTQSLPILSPSLLKLMSIKSVMPSNQFILQCPLLLLPSIFPNIRIFSNELTHRIKQLKYWSFSFSISLPINMETTQESISK